MNLIHWVFALKRLSILSWKYNKFVFRGENDIYNKIKEDLDFDLKTYFPNEVCVYLHKNKEVLYGKLMDDSF